MYYEILTYWVRLAHFSFTLPLIRQCFQCFFLFLLFFCFIFYFFKPKLFYWKLTELQIYVFNLINSTKLCSLLVTFVDTQETFQRVLNVAVRVIWRCDVAQCQINVETTLCMSKLKSTTLNNVKSTLSISTLILTTLDNIETILIFSM